MSETRPQPDRAEALQCDEHTLYWELFGNGTREIVCLLNGLAMHTPAWYGFLPRLQPDYDVLLWDYPGQGRSSDADVPYHLERIASYLVRILDRIGAERIHLVGISYGGFVALEFARQFQERLHTLAVSGILLSRETLFDMYEQLSLRFYAGGPEAFQLYTYYMYEKIFGETFVTSIGDRLETMRRNFFERYKDRTASLMRLTRAQDPFFSALESRMDAYRAIATPALVLAAEDDRVVAPKVQRKIASILPNSRFELIPDAGHVAYLERPDVFFGTLRKLFAAKAV
ncbi:MAG: 3-oxoadipate enol-lactonase [Thermoanaerobaculia bacterium]|jgi:pimeloyl-ACP methyl ester carboxylesterase|nr:3-oxoadipate enol-lactonase [Thermoanaerobaculia bacterium]